MTCSNLVDCLRKKNIYPVALEREWYENSKPQNALDYNRNNAFHSAEHPYNTLTIDFMSNISQRI